ncbi:nitrite reductase small subunit NirD [Litorilituus sediminis]|uniref:Nitrite reductase small subunit NirD n=1 Tax=Litorilituus sediminis TaxID=718192 RepID=A0A4V0ZGG1_9GAMM|nr:nitrite reductase small subunit NirD [Litorilituus sediminis]QBG37180.1 nitrite reductase small subunit NirD [Litorilituus sediminis]
MTIVASKAQIDADDALDWVSVCKLADIEKNTGVCAEFNGEQVAIFHLYSDALASKSDVKAVSNFDPFAQANVLSRGLITEKDANFHIASPLLKQEFCLESGQCLQDEAVAIPTYQARINQGIVELREGK